MSSADSDSIERDSIERDGVEKDSKRREAEEALRASEQRYRELLDNSPMLTGIISAAGQVLYANATFANLLASDAWDLVGQDFHGFVDENHGDSFGDLINEALRERQSDGTLTLSPEVGGHTLLVRLRSSEEDQETPCLVFSATDITAEVSARRDLEAANHEQREIMAALPAILIGLDPARRVNQWNASAETHLGISSDDALGRPFGELEIGWDREAVAELLERAIADRKSLRSEDLPCRRPDGAEALLGITLNPIFDEKGALSCVLLLGADVTASRDLQHQLAQAQKLESIGQLAAGIAHEINTPTQYVGDNVRFLSGAFDDVARVLTAHAALLDACEQGGDTAACVAEVRKAIEDADLEFLEEEIPTALAHSSEGLERVSKIVRAMKSFSHPGTDNRTNVNLNDCIESTVTVCANEWKYVADLELDLDPGLPLASCFPGELNQVFLNMIVNAAHAIEEMVGDGAEGKGRIGIATRRDGDHIEIRISDSGAGMSEEVAQRIFDPFFTTKGVGKGTGQGLAIAHRVVTEDHGGTIHVKSEPGGGAEFHIRVPIGIDSADNEDEVIG